MCTLPGTKSMSFLAKSSLSTGILPLLRPIKSLRKNANLFVFCLWHVTCKTYPSQTMSPQAPFQEPKGWPFSARCVAWTNSTRGPVASTAVLGTAPGCGHGMIWNTLAKGYIILYWSNFSRHVFFWAHFALRILKNEDALASALQMEAAYTPMHFCKKR